MYLIEIENHCLRELKKLDRTVVKRAFELIENVIAKDPFNGKKLKGKYAGLWSYRFSDYRIIYEIRQQKLLVVILKVRHRKNVYDGL
ncbi:MAG: type II toxin-antitoxin system RelE/ParE family toxin [Spirochaetes bacterium]|nr:type II toxin-antitoxin system RelE/ParE family toxin [Spirochaetota bacterium]